MTKDEAIAQIRLIERRCRGSLSPQIRKQVNTLLAQNKKKEASLLDASNRKGCGYDFNEVLINSQWDGIRRAYKCPKCGNSGYFSVTPFDGLEV